MKFVEKMAVKTAIKLGIDVYKDCDNAEDRAELKTDTLEVIEKALENGYITKNEAGCYRLQLDLA